MKKVMLDLRSKTNEDLVSELRDMQQELFNLKFQKATEQLENKARIGHVKQDISRIKTVLRERELSISSVDAKN